MGEVIILCSNMFRVFKNYNKKEMTRIYNNAINILIYTYVFTYRIYVCVFITYVNM